MNIDQPARLGKRRSQSHAQEVEFVVVKNKQLGRKIKAVPVPHSVKANRPVSLASLTSSVHASAYSTAFPTSFLDEDIPAKRIVSGKVECI